MKKDYMKNNIDEFNLNDLFYVIKSENSEKVKSIIDNNKDFFNSNPGVVSFLFLKATSKNMDERLFKTLSALINDDNSFGVFRIVKEQPKITTLLIPYMNNKALVDAFIECIMEDDRDGIDLLFEVLGEEKVKAIEEEMTNFKISSKSFPENRKSGLKYFEFIIKSIDERKQLKESIPTLKKENKVKKIM